MSVPALLKESLRVFGSGWIVNNFYRNMGLSLHCELPAVRLICSSAVLHLTTCLCRVENVQTLISSSRNRFCARNTL